MSTPRVKFTGTEQGLHMRLAWEDPLPQLLVELEEHLQKSRAFFTGAHVLLEMGDRPVSLPELEQIALVLSRYGVTLQGIVPAGELPEHRPSASPQPVTFSALPETSASVHFERRTVRSGEKIATEGHLVILGDVNPGAEVIAGYNIFVWGTLRGSAYAGIPDREEAIIAALHLAPIQLRIAGYIARAPEAHVLGLPAPELARIDGNTIVVEAWERGRTLQKRG